MKKIQAMSTVAVMALLFAGATQAQQANNPPVTVNGGTVKFTGELVNAACAVSTESANQTVQLGQHRTALFAKKGDVSASTPFTIKLNDCDPAIAKTASVAFQGALNAAGDELLSISSAGGGNEATGVGVEILDAAATTLKLNGSSFSAGRSLIAGTNTLHFAARYKSTSTTTTAGQANSTVNFIVRYD